jgi:hypothetical protein
VNTQKIVPGKFAQKMSRKHLTKKLILLSASSSPMLKSRDGCGINTAKIIILSVLRMNSLARMENVCISYPSLKRILNSHTFADTRKDVTDGGEPWLRDFRLMK